ncbi:MAG: hypothetical protein KAR20_09730, partial [Candidatus Heimdallarchaeota archaeon]|nr:hypothetical protein [Candidatus Heimdallarchaeota archaeon]
MSFDGVDDYVDVGNSFDSIQNSGELTVSAWAYNTNLAVDSAVVGRWTSQFSLWHDTGGVDGYAVAIKKGGGNLVKVGEAVASSVVNTWQFVTFTWDGTTLSVYVDGILKDSTTDAGAFDSSTANMGIGSDSGAGSSRPFNGSIDEVKIWNRALSASEINASYNARLYELSRNFTDLQGNYSYDSYVIDQAGNTNTTATEYLFVDSIFPLLNLISPLNSSGDSDGNLTFNYNVSDANVVVNCSFTFNNVLNQTNTSITKDTLQNFTLNDLAVGKYNFSLSCYDAVGNLNSTGTKIFSVIKTTGFSGSTTDLSQTDVSNISELIIEHPTYGMINFTDDIDLSNGSDIDTHVNISFNRIEINSTALPELDKSGNLTLYGLSFSNPQILIDGGVCPLTICKRQSYTSDGNLTFSVTGFSIYSARETPVITTTTTSSGGGGGGGVVVPKIKFTLTPETFEKDITPNLIKFGEIRIVNPEKTDLDFNIKVEVLEDMISFDEYDFRVFSGAEKSLEFKILGPEEPGLYTGKIIVSSGSLKKEVLVMINVKT